MIQDDDLGNFFEDIEGGALLERDDFIEKYSD